jgi:hypothetical protein
MYPVKATRPFAGVAGQRGLQLIEIFEVADGKVGAGCFIEDAFGERPGRLGPGLCAKRLQAETVIGASPAKIEKAVQVFRVGGLTPSIFVLVTSGQIVVPTASAQAGKRSLSRV